MEEKNFVVESGMQWERNDLVKPKIRWRRLCIRKRRNETDGVLSPSGKLARLYSEIFRKQWRRWMYHIHEQEGRVSKTLVSPHLIF